MQPLAALWQGSIGTCILASGLDLGLGASVSPIHKLNRSFMTEGGVSLKQTSLSCSIVVFRPDAGILRKTVLSLVAAADRCRHAGTIRLMLVDNDSNATEANMAKLLGEVRDRLDAFEVVVMSGHGNVGYGRAHNLAIAKSDCDYHLVLNPDVVLAEDALARAIGFMEGNPECGVLAPRIFDERETVQYLCKRYPNVVDLVLRGFMPAPVRRVFRERLDRYEMRDVIGEDVIWDVPIVSGCFMLFRRAVLARLGGFSPKYFLYFEDFDLSLRANRMTRVAYVPQVQIVHFGGQAAKKGWRHIAMFVRSAVTFFNQHGWKLW